MPGTVPAYHSVDYQFTSQLDLAFAVTNRPKFHNCPFISHLASTNAAVNIRSRNTPIFLWNFLQDLCRNLTWKKNRAWSKGALKNTLLSPSLSNELQLDPLSNIIWPPTNVDLLWTQAYVFRYIIYNCCWKCKPNQTWCRADEESKAQPNPPVQPDA